MPNQITHIVLTSKVFDQTFVKFNKSEFYIGTIFPDIRYLGVIDRAKTHFADVTLDSVLGAKTSFLAGLLFHNLVDKIFNKNVTDILPKIGALPDIESSTKLLADTLFYDQIDNWSEVVGYFDKVIPEELNFGIDVKDLLKWHEAVRNIFGERPTAVNRLKFMAELNFSEKQIDQANRSLALIRGHNDVAKILSDFYDNFDLIKK